MGRKLRPPTNDPRRASSLREVAARLGIPYEAARRLRRDGLETEPDGTFDIQKAKAFRESRAARGPNWPNPTHKAFTWKERKLKAGALHAEMELAQALGRLVEKEEVKREWRERVVTVKNRLKALGREVAPRVTGKGPQEAQAVIDSRVLEILRLLSHREYMP